MIDQLQPEEVEAPATPRGAGQSRRRVPSQWWPALPIVAAIVVGLAAGWLIGQGGSDDSPTVPAAMSETLDEWKAAVLAQDGRRIVALYTSDAVWRDEALNQSFRGAQAGWNVFAEIDEVVEVETEAISGDTAVVRWVFDGHGDWNLTGLSVLTFDDGVIVAETVYYDCAQSPMRLRCANMQ